MGMTRKNNSVFLLFLVFVLLLPACGSKETAATMHLRWAVGAVAVADGAGRQVEPREALGLYSGYQVDTQSESYAWIDLDEVKLTKMDQNSGIQIQKEGKRLEILVNSGSLFFNVTQPLAEDEAMEIRTSSMVVGIRGTCGWVTQDTAALLEGTVEVTAGERSVTISTGEMAVLTADGNIDVRPFRAASVPDFVRAEFEEDSALAEAVLNASGLDVLDPPTDDPIHSITYLADGTPNAQSEYTYDQQSNMTN